MALVNQKEFTTKNGKSTYVLSTEKGKLMSQESHERTVNTVKSTPVTLTPNGMGGFHQNGGVEVNTHTYNENNVWVRTEDNEDIRFNLGDSSFSGDRGDKVDIVYARVRNQEGSYPVALHNVTTNSYKLIQERGVSDAQHLGFVNRKAMLALEGYVILFFLAIFASLWWSLPELVSTNPPSGSHYMHITFGLIGVLIVSIIYRKSAISSLRKEIKTMVANYLK